MADGRVRRGSVLYDAQYLNLHIKAYTSEHIQSCQFDMFGDCMLIIQDEGQG